MDAVKYWMGELVNRAPSTRGKYRRFFMGFCDFAEASADELVEQRKSDLKSDDPRVQRRIESLLKTYIASLEEEGFSISSQQVAYAAMRSFFDAHYMPLRMRRGDYPSGESLGHRAITKGEIIRMLDKASIGVRALILFLKDCGLRVSDVARLKLGDLQPGLRNGYDFIPIQIITKKNKVQARTWIGPETVDALERYLDYRRRGTRRMPPEKVEDDSPVFRARTNEVRPLSRSGMSSTIAHMAKLIGLENEVSAHGFRKFFQTRMESSGMNPDWIDQVVGRKLVGARGSYSLPETRELFEVYQRCYDELRVQEVAATKTEMRRHEEEIRELRKELLELKEFKRVIEGTFKLGETLDEARTNEDFVRITKDAEKLYGKKDVTEG